MGCLQSTSKSLLCLLAFLVGLVLLFGSRAVRAQQTATFVVNSTDDAGDAEPGDFTCQTRIEGDKCTLRAALQEANAVANGGEAPIIEFEIGGSTPHVIQPLRPLPRIKVPVVVDATTEQDYEGAPVVVVDGANAGSDASGFYVEEGGGMVAKGLSVINFDDAAFLFAGDAGGNVVRESYLGVRSSGTVAAGNRRGVFVGSQADSTTIGGQTSEGNVIAGNGQVGLRIAAGATVQGNRIGVDINGNPMGNGVGISLNSDDASIGGSTGNVIAHNQSDGIEVKDLTPPNVRNTIRGNQIYANGGLGIDLEGGTETSAGRTENDAGDADDGQNRLQNFPEVQRSSYRPSEEALTITYRVPSDPGVDAAGASSYPLTVDFYVADADSQEGRAYLGTDSYSAGSPDDYAGCGAPPCTVTTTITPRSGLVRGDHLVATATDDGGNTSEFGAAVLVNFPPRFTDAGVGPFSVDEAATEGATVGDVDATNGDGGEADQGVSYRIKAGNDPDGNGTSAFQVDGANGVLSVASPGEVDFETRDRYTLTVEADDGTHTQEASVTIDIIDIPPPAATTSSATNVTAVGAQLNATVNPKGAPTTVTFTYYPVSTPSDTTTVTGAMGLSGTGEQTVSTTVSGLQPRTQYGYTVEATNQEGTDSGSEQTFTTSTGAPAATTDSATSVEARSAQLNGRVDPNGSETSVSFEYHPAGQPGESSTVVADQSPLTGTAEQNVSASVEGLDPGRTYVFQVLAENSEGSAEGAEGSFTTRVAPPVATTDSATNVKARSAQLNGRVDPNGSETSVSFEYHPAGQPGESSTVVADQSPLTGTAEQNVSAGIAGLDPGRTYVFRVVAESPEGIDEGSDLRFATEVEPPVVTTDSATNVTVSKATLNGRVDPNGAEARVTFEYVPVGQAGQVRVTEAAESPVTGNQEASVSARVEDLRPGTEYSVQVVASNTGGTTRGDETRFSTSALNLAVQHSPQVPDRGAPFDVMVRGVEGFEPTEAQLFFRQGGKTRYQVQALEASGATTFEGTVPGSAVTERGVEFYVRLTTSAVTVTVPENAPSQEPLFVPVRSATLTANVTLEPEQYQMISVPARLDTGDVEDVFADDFGQDARLDWRLLRWQPGEQQSEGCGAGQYEEVALDSGSSGAGLSPGQAYWLISRSGGTFDVEDARSVEPVPFTLTLPPGWTQVANPHPYPVAWSDVAGRAALQNGSPYAYDARGGQNDGRYVPNASVLDPWRGYWVCNPGSSPVEIAIPPREASSEIAGAAQGAASSNGGEGLFDRELAYALQLRATLDRNRRAVQQDVQNVVGVAPGATRGLGHEDILEPPPIRESFRLSIVEDSARLAGSLRPSGAEGHTWNLEVSAPAPVREATTVRVQLEAQGHLPSGFERRVIDRDTGRRIPIEAGRFSVSLSEEQTTRHLRLVVGTERFAEEASEAVQPSRTALRAVYPNPSAGPVFVDYQLETAQRVRIRIYDVLGRRVTTLVNARRPAGHHTARWVGGAGIESLASGTYIVRMKTESASASKRISIVR